MTTQESTTQASDNPATPVAPPHEVDADESSFKIPVALTGLAALVVGGLCFGKKGGLLAGLLGAGAKVLFNQDRTASKAIPSPPNAARHSPDEAASPSPELDLVAQKTEVTPEIPTPRILGEAQSADEDSAAIASIQETEALSDATADNGLAEVEPQTSEARGCAVETGLKIPDEPPPAISDEIPTPLSIESLPSASPIPDSALADADVPPQQEMGSEMDNPCSTSAHSPPKLIFNDPLDEVLENSEGFRNLGDTWSQRAALAMEPPLPKPSPQVSTPSDYPMGFPALSDADLVDIPNFVQWPSAVSNADSPTESATDLVFQDCLTKMFNEAAQVMVPTKAASNDPINGVESGTTPRVAPAAFTEQENFPSLPNLTPEDIWRLAAQASEGEDENGGTSAALQPSDPHDVQSPDVGRDSLIKMLGVSADVKSLASPGEPLVHSDSRNTPSQMPVADAKIGEQPELSNENSKRESIPLPIVSPFAQSQLATGSPPAPLNFPPRSIRLMDQKKSRKRWFSWKAIANLLMILGFLYVGYVFRAPLIKRWSGTTEGSERVPVRPSSPQPSQVIKALPEDPEPTPPPIATEPLPEPPPSSLDLPAVVPAPVKIEVRPATELPDFSSQPDAPSEASNPQAPPPEDAPRREAEITVKKFLAAATIGEVIPLILNAEKLGQTVQKYYGGNVVPPTPFDTIVLDTGARVPETNSRAFLFRVSSADRRQGFPICTEETPQGFKVEWEAFVQCRDRTHANFWKSPVAPAARLFVVLKRSHYFEEDVPNLEDYDCFSISSPNPDEDPVYAFAKKNSAFTQKYRTRLSWEASYFVVGTFSHVKSSNGSTHVEIEDIERFSWRNLGN